MCVKGRVWPGLRAVFGGKGRGSGSHFQSLREKARMGTDVEGNTMRSGSVKDHNERNIVALIVKGLLRWSSSLLYNLAWDKNSSTINMIFSRANRE